MHLPLSLLPLLFATLASAHSQHRNPLRALALVDHPSIDAPSHRVTALSSFDLSFGVASGALRVRLSLQPNHDILPAEGVLVNYLGPDGGIAASEVVSREAHKIFKGSAWVRRDEGGEEWERVGWARIAVRRDGVRPLFEGAFTVGRDHHHVQLAENYAQTRHVLDPEVEMEGEGEEGEYMVVFRDSDILPNGGRVEGRGVDAGLACMADELEFNSNPEHPVFSNVFKRSEGVWGAAPVGSLFGKRQLDTQNGGNSAGVNLASTIGQNNGCPTTRKVALVGVATDCGYTASFNSTESARQNIITQINTASSLYESTFNISLGLQNLTISDASCPGSPTATTPWNQPCSDSVQIQDRLNMFSAWRGTQQDDNAYWTLLSTCNTGSAVGLAWLGQACVNTATTANSSSGSESVSGANFVVRTSTEWQVIAHETGHTFGAVHDCTSQTCADANTVSSQQCCPLSGSSCDAGEHYIMNPSTAQGITTFSPCTVGNICSALLRNSVSSTCLLANKGVTTITGQQCGNGIVEAGEDCDCGGVANCGADPCCDPTTCKFTAGAVCDDSNDDCCSSCQLAANGTVCRASTGACDPAETCTGAAPTCPVDRTLPNGQACTLPSNPALTNLYCSSGQCTSRDLQCRTVMGSYIGGNTTYACDASTCMLSCGSPEFGPGVCYGLQQNFLDGTSCAGGGRCSNGACVGTNLGGVIGSWIGDHRALVIGLAVAFGSLLALAVVACCVRCCKGGRGGRRRGSGRMEKSRAYVAPPPPLEGGHTGGWMGAQQMQQQQRGYANEGGDWYGGWEGGSSRGGGGGGGGGGRAGWDGDAGRERWDGPMPPAYQNQIVRYA